LEIKKMAVKTWQTIKVCYCQHAGTEVGFEVEVIYPSDVIPDTPPRVVSHRCSHSVFCNLDDRPSCIWAGTNPTYDPFAESSQAR
jgi:hypothetical protein